MIENMNYITDNSITINYKSSDILFLSEIKGMKCKLRKCWTAQYFVLSSVL